MIASLPSDTYVWSMVTFEVVGVETKKLEPDSQPGQLCGALLCLVVLSKIWHSGLTPILKQTCFGSAIGVMWAVYLVVLLVATPSQKMENSSKGALKKTCQMGSSFDSYKIWWWIHIYGYTFFQILAATWAGRTTLPPSSWERTSRRVPLLVSTVKSGLRSDHLFKPCCY